MIAKYNSNSCRHEENYSFERRHFLSSGKESSGRKNCATVNTAFFVDYVLCDLFEACEKTGINATIIFME